MSTLRFGTLRFGTCSWKFPSWAGVVYSGPEADYLAEYARHYETVEIDQWFWSLFDTDSIGLPQVGTVAEYLQAVPENFRFTVKAPNSVTLTHFYKQSRASGPNPYFLSGELFADFLDRLEPMRSYVESVMLQFEYLNRQKMSGYPEFAGKLGRFLGAVGGGWPLAVEVRNPNYLTPPLFDLLADHGVTPVLCQGYYLPPVVEVYETCRDTLAGTTVVRLLGPDRQGIEKLSGKKWNRIVASKDAELPSIADMITDMLSRGLDVVVNVNNHYEGSAPLTIEKLERLVDERRERFSQIR